MYYHYEIVEGRSNFVEQAGQAVTKTYTVVQYEEIDSLAEMQRLIDSGKFVAFVKGGVPLRCRGGDKHWLTRELAEFAKDGYESGRFEHGCNPSRIEDAYRLDCNHKQQAAALRRG